MGRIDIVPYEQSHFDKIELREMDKTSLANIPDLKARLDLYAELGPAFSGITKDGKIAGIAGIVILWPGVGEAWFLTSPIVDEMPVFTGMAVYHKLNELIFEHRLHRVQTCIHIANHKSRRWIEIMGFKEEGLMRGYGANKESWFMYAKVRL